MRNTIRKMYLDNKKEEKWLNEMSSKGLALIDYHWCRYVFEDSPNNEYTYRIELLGHLPNHPESMAYLKFLEENGVEFVAKNERWVFLRKKTVEGPFDLYTDIDSRIVHYKKINRLWNIAILIFLSAIIFNFLRGLSNDLRIEKIGSFTLASVYILIAIIFIIKALPTKKELKKLKLEKNIRE